MDFADQMALAARLAHPVPQIGAVERQRFRAVLLDEFQDTSRGAAAAAAVAVRGAGRARAGHRRRGPHQSIYGWRGASADHPRAGSRARSATRSRTRCVLPLSTSWRNDRVDPRRGQPRGGARCATATRVHVEQLRPSPGPGADASRWRACSTVEDEAAHVAEWIAARRARPAPPAQRCSAASARSSPRSSRPWRHGHPLRGRRPRRPAVHARDRGPRRAAARGAGPHPRRPADAAAHRAARAGSARPTSTG